MAKVLFINPVIREEDQPKHIPYGIALLAAISLERGHQVQIYDANAWRLDDSVLEQACQADDWDVIAIGGLTTAYRFIKRAFRIAKRCSPGALRVAGGGFLTSMPREIMQWIPEIDLGVVGEGFITWPEILERIDKQESDYSNTLGVCYRNEDGAPRLTRARPNIANLDTLPWPAWDLLPLEIYFSNSATLYSEECLTSHRRIDINGSLGCSLVCKFCWHLGTTGDMVIEPDETGENDVRFTYGRNIRYHSPEYIVRMVKHLYDTHHIDFASFIDENLMTMDRASGGGWLLELSERWIEAGLQPSCRHKGVPHDSNCKGVHWSGTSHAGLHRREVLDAMFRAGCANLVYGLESFDPGILKKLGKGTTAKKNKQSVQTCLESGIRPIPNIIIGFPEESFESIRNTIRALLELGIHARPHFATAYPGSEWYYTYKDSIVEQYDGDLEAYVADLGDASQITATISHRFSAAELLGLQEIVHRRSLRLLDLTETQRSRSSSEPLVVPKESFNVIKRKINAPLEAS